MPIAREPKEGDKVKYFTNRFLSKRGEKNYTSGAYTKIWVFTGESIANVKYKCPYCLTEGSIQKEWSRPFKFTCDKCGKTIKIPKLKT